MPSLNLLAPTEEVRAPAFDSRPNDLNSDGNANCMALRSRARTLKRRLHVHRERGPNCLCKRPNHVMRFEDRGAFSPGR